MNCHRNNKITCLITDGNANECNLTALAVSLLFPAFRLIFAKTGEEALRKIEEFLPELVLSELSLADMSGIDIINGCIARNLPAQNILFLTGDNTFLSAQKAVRAGAYDYVLKPVDHAELKLAIERFLENRKKRCALQSKLVLKTQADYLHILHSGIVMLESKNKQCELLTVRNQKIPISQTLKSVEEQFAGAGSSLIRIGKFNIINTEYIHKINHSLGKLELCFAGCSKIIYLSRNAMDELKQKLNPDR